MLRIKSIISILIILPLVFVVGCNSKGNATEKADVETWWKETAREVNFPGAPVFEGILDRTTDLVKATYVETRTMKPYYYHVFSVKKVIKGTVDNKGVLVGTDENDYLVICIEPKRYECFTDATLDHSTYDIKYEANTDYLLLLKRYSSEKNVLLPVEDSLIISYNGDGDIHTNNAQMCGNLIWRFLSTDIKNELKEKNFEEVITDRTKNNPPHIQDPYLQ